MPDFEAVRKVRPQSGAGVDAGAEADISSSESFEGVGGDRGGKARSLTILGRKRSMKR